MKVASIPARGCCDPLSFVSSASCSVPFALWYRACFAYSCQVGACTCAGNPGGVSLGRRNPDDHARARRAVQPRPGRRSHACLRWLSRPGALVAPALSGLLQGGTSGDVCEGWGAQSAGRARGRSHAAKGPAKTILKTRFPPRIALRATVWVSHHLGLR